MNQFEGKTYLFETKDGEKYKREFVSNEIKRQAKNKASISATSHTLRHSKSMYLKDVMKLTPDEISKALGNTLGVCLKYYFHNTPSAEQQGIE